MLILGLVQAVMAIVASGFSCAAVCCRKNSKFHGTVIFAPSTNTNGQTYAPAPVALNGQTATQSEGKYLQVSGEVYLLLHFRFLHFQKCHFQIFWKVTFGIIQTL